MCPVIQGYGLTETCAGATIALVTDPTFGHVGCPIGSVGEMTHAKGSLILAINQYSTA